MVRRVGILGAALLAVHLTAGCVTTGGGSNRPPADVLPPQEPPRSPAPEWPVRLPSVTEPPPAYPTLIPPPPLPERGDIQPVRLLPAPPPAARPPRPTAELAEPPPLTAVSRFFDKHPAEGLELLKKYQAERPEQAAEFRDWLKQAAAAMQPPPSLGVEKMCYCRRISNYGLYDPLPDDHGFLAGADRRHGELVQLYVEVRNFVNRRNGNFYETSLASRLEIRDAQGGLAARMEFPAQPDRSLSARQDYFIHYQFHVPAMMEPGDYWVTITLRDANASGGEVKAARTLRFRVCAAAPGRAANAAPR
jgi:hypothetical protein